VSDLGAGMRLLISDEITDEAKAEIRNIAPGIQVSYYHRRHPEYLDALRTADIVVASTGLEDVPEAHKLRWLQLSSAGVGNLPSVLPPHVILTNGSGIYGIPIAEHVLAMMLAMVREIPICVRNASQARWVRMGPKRELYGATCGILGLGDIGMEVARRAKALGMRVVAVKRRPDSKPDFVDELWDTSGLDHLLQQAAHVVRTLPGTAHTRHMLDARRLALMNP